MARLWCFLIGYALGLIQTAYIVGKCKGVDIRNYGSGNSGTTNALRVLGTKAGLIVFAGDMLKAIIVPQAAWIQGRNDEELEEALKRELLEPYNQEVPPYKRLMSLFVYHGDLPRTKMDKLDFMTMSDALPE